MILKDKNAIAIIDENKDTLIYEYIAKFIREYNNLSNKVLEEKGCNI